MFFDFLKRSNNTKEAIRLGNVKIINVKNQTERLRHAQEQLNNTGILIEGGNREGIDSYLSTEEIGMATHYTLQRWIQCQNLAYKIGNEKSSITEYDRVTMISIPLSGNELFLISTEPGADYSKIIREASGLLEK